MSLTISRRAGLLITASALIWLSPIARAQEGPADEPLEKKTRADNPLLEKKLLEKKLLEKKTPADSRDADAAGQSESGLTAEDLFGIDDLGELGEPLEADQESLVDEVRDTDQTELEVVEEEVPDLLELLAEKAENNPEDLDLWEKFLLHLKEEGHDAVIEEMGLDDVDNPIDFTQGDPVRGVLFRISGDLLRLDTLFSQAAGTPLEGRRRERALEAAERLRTSEDPFLRVYGDYYQARLELEVALEEEPPKDDPEGADDTTGEPKDQGDTPEAVRDTPEAGSAPDAPKEERAIALRVKDREALDRAKKLLLGLTVSEYFLPQDEARRYLAQIYLALGDATLAILEWQLYLTELPRARQAERTQAEERIREIRESTDHPGPLRESTDRMRLVSGRLDKGDVSEPTQSEEVRLEDVLEKIARLLEKAEEAGGSSMSMQGQASMRSQLQQGQRQRKRQSQQLQQLARNGQQRNQQGQPNQPNQQNQRKREHAGSQEGETALRDPGEKDREAWGRVNVRDVATSLKGVWDKIPVTYRQLVTQYFRDISDLSAEPHFSQESSPAGAGGTR